MLGEHGPRECILPLKFVHVFDFTIERRALFREGVVVVAPGTGVIKLGNKSRQKSLARSVGGTDNKTGRCVERVASD